MATTPATPATETLAPAPGATGAGLAGPDGQVVALRRPRAGTLRALLRHGPGMAGLAGLLLMAAMAVVGPRLLVYGPNEVNVVQKLAPPSAAHPLGTDYLGRDVLSRVVDAAPRSLGTASVVVVCVLSVSVVLGALAGFAGGASDVVVMRLVDLKLALPSLVLALVLVGAMGPRLSTLVLALTIASVPWYVRIIRTLVLRERERPYVLVARVHRAGPVAVVRRHVLPAVLGQLVVLATLDLGQVVLAVAALSFLGLGAQPPDAEWGAMLSDGRITFVQQPMVMIAPGFCIFLTVLSANLLGDALRDILDPTWKRDR
jgi:ABC-type dipeptide/oligopeptide/nickel transport system permease subunit